MKAFVGTRNLQQPSPNLVDAALVRPHDPNHFTPEILGIGPLVGMRDLVLGDQVQKVGRTTEHTYGTVVGIDGSVRVNYGDSGFAQFDHQLIIESNDGNDFSAGGDSGSAIVTLDGYIGGLLFAGGGGQTIANYSSDVVAYMPVRF